MTAQYMVMIPLNSCKEVVVSMGLMSAGPIWLTWPSTP